MAIMTRSLLFSFAVPLVTVSSHPVQVSPPQEKTEEAQLQPKWSAALNSFNFNDNVLKSNEDQHVVHWIVSFCVPWWEICQDHMLGFERMALEWQPKLNTQLLTHEVRFAVVNCATDKVLCNTQGVETYPWLGHYVGGRQVSKFWKYTNDRGKDKEAYLQWIEKQVKNMGGAAVVAQPVVLSTVERLKENASDLLLLLLCFMGTCRLVFSAPELGQKATFAAQTAKDAGREAAHQEDGRFPSSWADSRSSIEL